MNMTESQFATALKELCVDYFNRNMSMAEFRVRRKYLVDRLDAQANGGSGAVTPEDITQRPEDRRS